MVFIVEFFIYKILNIIGSKIEIERIFLWWEYLLILENVVL
jgi:hypothetical protein